MHDPLPVKSGSGGLAVAYPAVDHRSGIRAVRALADGAPAFVSAIEASPDFDPDAFASFAAQGNVREWLALAVDLHCRTKSRRFPGVPEEALRIIGRKRRSLANRAWFLSVRGPVTPAEWGRSLAAHGPLLVWRALRPRTRGEARPWEQVAYRNGEPGGIEVHVR
jgi:hypothetical protein